MTTHTLGVGLADKKDHTNPMIDEYTKRKMTTATARTATREMGTTPHALGSIVASSNKLVKGVSVHD